MDVIGTQDIIDTSISGTKSDNGQPSPAARKGGGNIKARITVIANQKGGVGKTTTAHALATGLTYKGYKTLALDTDPQGNLSYTMNADDNKPGVYELLKDEIIAPRAVQNTEQGAIICSSMMLSGADLEFTGNGREYLLSEALEPFKTVYDFIVIDTPPTLGMLTINALVAADDVIIPMGADIFSLQGLSQLYATIGQVKRRCNPGLDIAGVLITRYSGRAILSGELRETIGVKARQIHMPLYKTVIREGISVREAQTQQTSIFKTKIFFRSNAASDYLSFIEEYIGGAKNG